MRHYKKGRKLGSDASHTKAIKKSLVVALFTNDRIKTTLERAKEIRGDIDRIITLAKRGDVHARRLAIARLGNKDLVAEIFAKVEQGLFKGREGGYSRILKLGKRRGDSSVIVILELVQEPVVKKDKSQEKDKTAKPKSDAKTKAKVSKQAEEDDVKSDEEEASTTLAEVEGKSEEESESDKATESEAAEAAGAAEGVEVAAPADVVPDAASEKTVDTSVPETVDSAEAATESEATEPVTQEAGEAAEANADSEAADSKE